MPEHAAGMSVQNGAGSGLQFKHCRWMQIFPLAQSVPPQAPVPPPVLSEAGPCPPVLVAPAALP